MKKARGLAILVPLTISMAVMGCASEAKVNTIPKHDAVQQTEKPEAAQAAVTGPKAVEIEQVKSEVKGIKYTNNEYGFTFDLPSTWKGYQIVSDKWEGNSLKQPNQGAVVQTGPIILIRHPEWKTANPRQDIPIMVFTLQQWNSLQQSDYHIGAAPINPKELGRNGKFVFALPARYNFAFLPGYEEVEKLIESGALKPVSK